VTLTADRIERMLTYITLGKTKDDFGTLSAEESTAWDEIAADVTQQTAKGIAVEIPSEWRG
jgi:cAMP phosphodiesterase